MKIERIKITNILGARHVDIETTSPVTLFAAFNGHGKSSVQEAVRMAFTAETFRVKLKKEYASMVSEGAKVGTTVVTTDSGTASYALPAGTHTLEGDLQRGLPDALPYVLNAQGFASMSEEARRTFLFALTNCSVTEATLRRLLKEAGCDDKKVEEILPLLKSITGFPAAAKFAAEKSTEAKGAWRGVAGETYGSKKAEGWEAEKPEVDNDALAEAAHRHAELQEELSAVQEGLGRLKAQRGNLVNELKKREQYTEKASQLDRLNAKQDVDKESLTEWETKVSSLESQAGTAPRVGLVHDFARAAEEALDTLADDQRASTQSVVAATRAAFDTYVAQFGLPSNAGDPEVLEQLQTAKQALTLMRNSVSNNTRDIAIAQAAAEALTAALPEEVSEADIRLQDERTHTIAAALREAGSVLAALRLIADKAEQADEKTAKAAKHHADVTSWGKLADQLGPDGIPAQLLAQALRPINTALRQSALITNWRQATINPDMSITAEGRAYNLLCESEKWRVDAMIAGAIAELSDVRVLMLDRVDVLDNTGRVELLTWLNGRAEAGAIKSALLFATLKQMPKGLPENITAVWIENGELVEQEQAADQAAA